MASERPFQNSTTIPDDLIKVGDAPDDVFNSPLFNLLVITLPWTLLELFDLVVNAINVCVFAVLGLNSPADISFFTVDISDLMRVLFILYDNFCVNPYSDLIDASVKFDELFFVTGAFPLGCVIRVTLHTTIYLTVERFLCVLFPLRVKAIITKNVTIGIILFIVIGNFLTMYPVYMTFYLKPNFYSKLNKTLLGSGVVYVDPVTYDMTYFLHAFLVAIGLGILIIFTFALAFQLSQKSSWRTQHTSKTSNQKSSIQSRDKKSIKLVLVIALSFAIFFSPLTLVIVLAYYVPEFSFGGPLDAAFHHLYSAALVCMSINSSTNIIIFFKLSKNYRETFTKLISLKFNKNMNIFQ